MPTSRFCELIGMPERTWRRHQARTRTGHPVKGPWPRPARTRVREAVRAHALAHPAWGHRKVWAMVRYDGHRVSQATVLRLLRDEGLLLEANYQRERRELAANRRAAFATAPTGPIPASGSWTSPSSRPRPVGPGGSPAAGTTGRSTPAGSTSPRPRTSTTRSPRSSSPWPRPPSWAVGRCATSPRSTSKATSSPS